MSVTDKGFIHSIESLGCVDGPGVRSVVFMQGCPLRCAFCHNPDAAFGSGMGQEISGDELFSKLMRFSPYWGDNGGVTFSGGEPLMQFEFVRIMAKKLKKCGVHVAIDTSCYAPEIAINALLPVIDLWMVSYKHADPLVHQKLTGVRSDKILQNIRTLTKAKKNVRLRYLVIPGLTDTTKVLTAFVGFVKSLESQIDIELLAYGKHGQHKKGGRIDLDMSKFREAQKSDLQEVASFVGQRVESKIICAA